ncbi:hypothetical protein [Bradyrhizobium japonicum]|uniref:hypothetical protein n=1 Tax=Bradyrhizobium japonicum TaxID=375 RepID=UPI000559B054|nr:hypothetical protein [Bradyrhizobium japonicum]AJA62859.1 hypothetical protein RN69_22850 [Bradyrhizobium japonicum]MCS3540608.1 hypothetical protein [Bradyrhizobium japonicum]MCS4208988.1 hypothetical protein [Bradyrhizobium japonicum]MYV83006.1 hypothetical protein [Bradyrhizobium japonicum]
MTDLETLIVKEADRQGRRANQDAIRQAGVDLAGASLTSQGLISLPGRGCISPADFVRDLHSRMPECFGTIDSEPPTAKAAGNLTERYKAEIAASRTRSRITEADLARYSGITRQHLEERYGAAKAK